MRHKIMFLVCTSVFFGCTEKPEPLLIKKIDVGFTVSAEAKIIPFEFDKTITTTSKADILVLGGRSIIKGQEAHLEIFDDETRYLCIAGEDFCWLVE